MNLKRKLTILTIAALTVAIISVTLILHYQTSSPPETSFAWKQDAVGGFDNFGTATYKDGVLYAPSKADNKIYAINATNGQTIWNTTVRQPDASPYIDTDAIYVGECSGPGGEPTPRPKAIALNKTTGQEIWHYTEPTDTPWVGSPVKNSDYIYYTTLGTGVYALNKTNGNPIWHQNIGKIVGSIAYNADTTYISAQDPPGQYALNATTGDVIWHVNHGASWDTSPVLYQDMVIQVARNITTDTMSTYVLNQTNGQLIRELEGTGSSSTPLIHEDKIFIPSSYGKIWAINLTTGQEIWHTQELTTGTVKLGRPDVSYCSPALANGLIYYQSLSGTFYVINETDGTTRSTYALNGYGFGSPSIGNRKLFITNDSALYAFNIDFTDGDWPMFCKNNLHQSIAGQ
jgi:outer membrane protein assembly factor BamB